MRQYLHSIKDIKINQDTLFNSDGSSFLVINFEVTDLKGHTFSISAFPENEFSFTISQEVLAHANADTDGQTES